MRGVLIKVVWRGPHDMEVLVSARYLVISSASAPVPEYNVTFLQLSSKSPISFCLLWRRFCEPFAQDRLFSIDSNIALRNLNLKIANIFIFKLISILSLTSPAVVDVLTAERTLFEKLLTVNVMEEPKFDLQKFIKNHLKFYMLNVTRISAASATLSPALSILSCWLMSFTAISTKSIMVQVQTGTGSKQVHLTQKI